MSIEEIKKMLGKFAKKFVAPGMVVGLGSGTTASHFIKCIGTSAVDIVAVPTSTDSEQLAKAVGIKLAKDYSSIESIDVVIDGADEIDANGFIIKGGGGALVREKIVANSSRTVIIIVDYSKISTTLGSITKHLPTEILPFCASATIKTLADRGLPSHLRSAKSISDNGNMIIDVDISKENLENPLQLHEKMMLIPGIVDTGIFILPKAQIFVGKKDGSIERFYPKGY